MSSKQTEVTEEIVNDLQNFPLGKSMDDIIQRTDAPQDSVEEAVSELEADGRLMKVGNKYRAVGQ